MARIPYLTAETAVDPAGRLGDVPGWDTRAASQVQAHSPAGLVARRQYLQWMHESSSVPARLRELAILQVGFTTRTAYEWVHHVELGMSEGLSPDDVRAIGRETAGESTHLSGLESWTLRAARELTSDLTLSDETFEHLTSMVTTEQVVDLITIICFYNGVVRMLRALQVDIEPHLAAVLTRFPLPR